MPLPDTGCRAVTAAHDIVQTCGKQADHTDSANSSRRAHQDFETGHRWVTAPGDDPLKGFVRYVSPVEGL